MKFDPFKTANVIRDTFRSYTAKTFFINDPELQEEFQEELNSFDISNGPFIESPNSFKQGRSIRELVDEGVFSKEFITLMQNQEGILTRPLYAHQEKAIRLIESGRNAVVTTGTGSGKTECFLYPILDSLLKEKENGTLNPGVRVLLLYPMNALISDQMERLRNMLKDYPDITFGAYNGNTEETTEKALENFKTLHNGMEPIRNELISRYQMIQTPPHILITNYSMLEYLMLRPRENVFFSGMYSKAWKYIVLDEAHTYSGATGMEVSMLLRRLYHTLENKSNVRFILTSATLGDENADSEICDFAQRLCAGSTFESSDIIRAERVFIDTPSDTISASDEQIAELENSLEAYLDSVGMDNEDVSKKKLGELLVEIYGCSYDENIKKLMFESIKKEKLYTVIRNSLNNGVENIEELANGVNRTVETVMDIIHLANFAQMDGTKLIDSRYHFFVRTLEGAFVTLLPEKTITLTPRKKAIFNGEEWNCYKLSVCQFCGAIYLQIINDPKKKNDYYMVVGKNILETIRDEAIKLKVLDCRTNKISDYHANRPLKGSELLVMHCNSKDESSKEINRCAACGTVSINGSVLRSFYLGQDASCSVVFESLYEELPSRRIKVQTGGRGFGIPRFTYKDKKSILSFADSRQDAAFFASYYQYTYDVINGRRSLLAAIRESHDKSLPSILQTLSAILERQGMVSAANEAFLIILSEMKEFTRNSLRNSGWIEYDIPELDIGDVDGSDLLIRDSKHPDLTIKKTELQNILLFFVKQIIRHGAMSHGFNLTEKDIKRFSYSGRQPVIMLKDIGENSKYDVRYLIPTNGRNTLTQFLEKIGVRPEKTKEFIHTVFETLVEYKILITVTGENNKYWVNSEKIKILYKRRDNYNLWKCDKCGRLTNLNIHGKCGTYNCDGSLIPFDFENEVRTNYFSNQYVETKKPYKFQIKEHTAQLNNNTAKKYQKEFIDGEVQALSCSTTFEMGVDVGDLNAVFMKNMPPKPSNYVQRAGRAGRRTDSDAFILTFCRLSSHDFYFFNNPKRMIEGKITPPIFKVDNKKIVERHVYSAIASWYWKKMSDVENVKDFFTEEKFTNVLKYIDEAKNNSDFKSFILNILPSSELQNQYSVLFDEYIEKLKNARNTFNGQLDEIINRRQELYNEGVERIGINSKRIRKLENMVNTINEIRVIDYYSRNNLIPKYGFPVDTVHLSTDPNYSRCGDSEGLDLQRDMAKAISEYAPGAEVIADGNIYRSRYILKPFSKKDDKTWDEEIIALCPKCLSAIRVSDIFDVDKLGEISCTNCGNSIKGNHVLFPRDGFTVEINDGEKEKATTKKPKKESHSEFYYLGREGLTSSTKIVQFGIHSFTMETTSDDEMYVQNNLDFCVCEKCGYALAINEYKPSKLKHKNLRGDYCNGSFLDNSSPSIKLGHSFKTDVTKLSFNVRLSQPQAMTVLYTLIEGFCTTFGIDRDNIDGLITLPNSHGSNKVVFYIFDSTPGGSGNSKKLYKASNEELRKIFQTAYDLVNECDCGGENGDSVCYSCLCNYNNQKWHDSMKRKYAITFFSWLLGNEEKLVMEE